MNRFKIYIGRLDNWQRRQLKTNVIFIVLTSIICIFLAELTTPTNFFSGKSFFFRKPRINKGIEFNADNSNAPEMGSMITKYRFQEFGECNPEEIDVNAPMIALTFDDGPNPDYTERILDVLKSNYSHATFFVVGTNAEKYPEVLKDIYSSGCEIGNHTNNHKRLTDLSYEDVSQQIEDVNRIVNTATGAQTTVIRPPYGAYDDYILSLLSEPVVLWDLDTEDWDSRNAETIVERVLSTVKDGDIVLMHDIYDSTAEAIEMLIPKLKERGFLIMSVSEMARYKGKELEPHKPYGKIAGEQVQK